jgi:crossover junction endodeoxyribonuclease RusA
MSGTLFIDPTVVFLELRFMVVGTPAAQGSKKHVGNGVMVESSKLVKPWREDVANTALACARDLGWVPPREVVADIVFLFRRPKHHYGTGRNTTHLKPGAPYWHSGKPDVDKLQRSTFDALTTAGVITDDARIVHVTACKRYAEAGQPTGALITLTPAEDPQ